MAKNKFSSPTLTLAITEENWEKAMRSNSGGCLVADAIKRQYPNLTNPVVDMATVRATDKARGVRYTYLTPPSIQHCLLAFDQGWPQPVQEVVVRRAVKIDAVTRGREATAKKAERLAELSAKKARGEELTAGEKGALSRLLGVAARPTARGPVEVGGKAEGGAPVVTGGNPIVQGEPHPNLLRGRNRHFGAKMADPGIVFQQAVDAAVEQRLAKDAAVAELPGNIA